MFLYSSFPPFMLLFSQITAVYIVRPSDTIRYRILGWQFFLSAFEYVIPLSSGIHGFWWEFGCESYQGPLITHHFSLDFNILSLSFWKFAYDTLDLFEFILIGDLLWCVDLFFFLIKFGKFCIIISSTILPASYSFSFWDSPYLCWSAWWGLTSLCSFVSFFFIPFLLFPWLDNLDWPIFEKLLSSSSFIFYLLFKSRISVWFPFITPIPSLIFSIW